MRYFGLNIVEGVPKRLLEAEMNWEEVEIAEWRWMELGGAGCTV